MKKILSVIGIMLLIVFNTGCGKELIEEEQRDEIIKTLENENLIDDSWSYVDLVIDGGSLPLGRIMSYNYGYKDINDNYYIVNIDTLSYEKDIKRYRKSLFS